MKNNFNGLYKCITCQSINGGFTVIFDGDQKHAAVAKRLSIEPVYAGFISIEGGSLVQSGYSMSLGLGSDSENVISSSHLDGLVLVGGLTLLTDNIQDLKLSIKIDIHMQFIAEVNYQDLELITTCDVIF